MVGLRCTPLTFLLTGFTWLLLASLIGIATLLGLVYGTPLPRWLRTVHAHGALIGGLLQLLIGGLLASIAYISEDRQGQSTPRPGLYFSFNAATLALLASLGYGHMQLAAMAGLLLLAVVATLARSAWEHVQEELAGPPNAAWIYLVSAGALFIGLLVGIGMALQLAPEYFAHARLLHLHAILLGFFTVILVAVSHQLLPIVLRKELASLALGRATIMFLFAGFAALIGGFVTSSLRFELVIGSLLLFVTALYAVNLFRTWIASGFSGNATSDHLLIATLFLVLATGTGILMGANYLSEPPFFPMGSLHMTAYTHLAFLGFMVNTMCGALSYGLPLFLAASRVPNQKKRGTYREQLDSIMNRWRTVQLVGISFGTMGLAVTAALTWTAPLGALSVRVSTWIAAALLLTGLTVFAAKLAWIAGIDPVESTSH
jgi:hypothetical protein